MSTIDVYTRDEITKIRNGPYDYLLLIERIYGVTFHYAIHVTSPEGRAAIRKVQVSDSIIGITPVQWSGNGATVFFEHAADVAMFKLIM